MYEETFSMVMEIDQWGKQYGLEVFLRDRERNLLRRKARGQKPGTSTQVCTFDTKTLMATMRRKVLEKKVQLIERVMVTDLVEWEGSIIGAIGLHTRTGEFYFFRSKAIILAAGGCTFKSFYLGHRNMTGEAQAMAYQAGAALRNLEQAMSNSTAREVDIHGMGGLSSVGKFVNKLGEEFMWRYDPLLGNRAMMHTLTQSFAKEVSAGRGPIYFDLSGAPESNRDYFRNLLPEFFRSLDRIQIDPFRDRVEWMPAFLGTIGYGGGLHVNLKAETTRKGLFAIGDAAASEHCLMFCCSPGDRAAKYAVERAEERREYSEEAKRGMAKAAGEVISLLTESAKREKEIDPDEIIYDLQSILIPYDVCYIRSEDRLKRALNQLERIKFEKVPKTGISDLRDFIKIIEIRSMILIAEMILKAALFRRESRGFHYREDYPTMDNKNWLKWVMIERKGEQQMHLYSRDIPLPYVKPE
jgi:succinate dehydrogenase/fumarate reductase flavoprotein subunit